MTSPTLTLATGRWIDAWRAHYLARTTNVGLGNFERSER